jgi:hypothetical protein
MAKPLFEKKSDKKLFFLIEKKGLQKAWNGQLNRHKKTSLYCKIRQFLALELPITSEISFSVANFNLLTLLSAELK